MSIFRSAVRTVAARCTLPFALHRCKRRHRRGGARRRKYLSRNIAVMAQRRHHQCQTTRAWKVLDCVARGEGFGFWVLVAPREEGPWMAGRDEERFWFWLHGVKEGLDVVKKFFTQQPIKRKKGQPLNKSAAISGPTSRKRSRLWKYTEEEKNKLTRLCYTAGLSFLPPFLWIGGGGVWAFDADGSPEQRLRCASRSPNRWRSRGRNQRWCARRSKIGERKMENQAGGAPSPSSDSTENRKSTVRTAGKH